MSQSRVEASQATIAAGFDWFKNGLSILHEILQLIILCKQKMKNIFQQWTEHHLVSTYYNEG